LPHSAARLGDGRERKRVKSRPNPTQSPDIFPDRSQRVPGVDAPEGGAMTAVLLTDELINSLLAPERGNRITFDTEIKGFGIRITKGDARSFVFNYCRKDNSLQRRLTIGAFGTWTTIRARAEAKRLKREVNRYNDPMGDPPDDPLLLEDRIADKALAFAATGRHAGLLFVSALSPERRSALCRHLTARRGAATRAREQSAVAGFDLQNPDRTVRHTRRSVGGGRICGPQRISQVQFDTQRATISDA
jgi:hypothetical protein